MEHKKRSNNSVVKLSGFIIMVAISAQYVLCIKNYIGSERITHSKLECVTYQTLDFYSSCLQLNQKQR